METRICRRGLEHRLGGRQLSSQNSKATKTDLKYPKATILSVFMEMYDETHAESTRVIDENRRLQMRCLGEAGS